MIMTTDYESIHDKLVDFIKTRGNYNQETTIKIAEGLKYPTSTFAQYIHIYG